MPSNAITTILSIDCPLPLPAFTGALPVMMRSFYASSFKLL